MKKSILNFFTLTICACALFFSSCTDIELGSNTPPSATEGLSGDFSRTLIVGDFLYAVDQTSVLTYDISNRDEPQKIGQSDVGLALETIYHHEGNLFIGSRRGMYIYTISRNGTPVKRGDFDYSSLPNSVVEPCDPVVAENSTAYASLYTGDDTTDGCGRAADYQTIVVLDVSNIATEVIQYDYTDPSNILELSRLVYPNN